MGVELPGVITVSRVRPVGRDLAVFGSAEHLGLGRHHRISESLYERTQDVRALFFEVRANERDKVHAVDCSHRCVSFFQVVEPV